MLADILHGPVIPDPAVATREVARAASASFAQGAGPVVSAKGRDAAARTPEQIHAAHHAGLRQSRGRVKSGRA
ncbi:hypothetical protein [Gluconacetobacter diazotrophicus]|uniref:Uncharacterized protein n=2 Tax=Gluconacetobacter diazotrophicus TaxID=33996 RepID=A9H7M2_GLUDA|nr:hypothetical protein [Gluconacetobacter diazotrophicus]MBB2157057.1 hypothetical protein [Gluconacetobacter diazotrophicus]CAP57659.1 hypothetical protein GDI3716 [Gluconacetobacter diazotrophicus PA1 5]